MDNPTLGPQFDIDRAAQRYVRETLEGNWIVRDRNPDIFVDYEIEERKGGEPSGRVFYMQLKGRAAVDPIDGDVRQTMETKHLRYYATAVQIPVFLVVVDTARKKACYLFLQRWLDENQRGQKMAEQATMTVMVPFANQLDNYPRLAADCTAALAYMRDKYPGRPEAAISSLEKRYRQLDPRFDVQITSTSRNHRVDLWPREPVDLQMSFDGIAGEHVAGITRTLEWGKPFQADNVQFQIKGSPLLEEFSNPQAKARVVLKPGGEVSCVLQIHLGTKRRPAILSVPARLSMGAKGTSIETVADDSPFWIELQIFWSGVESGVRGRVRTEHRFKTWVGREVQSLARVIELAQFAESARRSRAIRFKVQVNGHSLDIGFPRQKTDVLGFETLRGWYRLVADAVIAAKHFGLNPLVIHPCEITAEIAGQISFAYDASRSRVVRRDWFSVSYQEDIIGPERWEDLIKRRQLPGVLKGAFRCEIRIFDAKRTIGTLEVGPVRCRLKPVGEPGSPIGKGFQFYPIGRRAIDLVVREEGKDSPQLGIVPDNFYFEPDEAVDA